MKKLAVLLLVGVMTFSCVACGGTNGTTNGGNDTQQTENQESKVEIADATELLTKVWATYGEDEKFMAMGGDYNNIVDGAPGKCDVADAETLRSMLCFPTASVENIDDAASLIHGMMANNFTAGAYHVKDAGNVEAIVTALKDEMVANQWMCGIPEKLCIATVGDDYVVAVFGAGDIIETFKTKLTDVYGDAVAVVAEQALNE
ncbi:MAG: hypothetical protein IKJ01_08230 [Lachnospiraceae bacterium]|nr:hypothetical protein [Lachnospiraceae bacterium]